MFKKFYNEIAEIDKEKVFSLNNIKAEFCKMDIFWQLVNEENGNASRFSLDDINKIF